MTADCEDESAIEGDVSPRTAAAIERIRARGEAVRDDQVERALAELEDLDEREREVIERLADDLVDQLLDVPERGLAAADDERTVETALALFG